MTNENDEKTGVVAFIGHREVYKIDIDRLSDIIEDEIKKGAKRFLCGGMGDFDYICAAQVRKLQDKYKDIKCELVIPYLTFKPRDDKIFDDIIYPEGMEKFYFKNAIEERNKWMIKKADAVICYVEHKWGNAWKMMKFAEKSKKIIINYKNESIKNQES